MKRALVIAAMGLTGLLATRARADDTARHRYQTWTSAFVHGPLGRNVFLWTDLQLRFHDSFEPVTFIARPGISFQPKPQVFVTVGYGWVPQFLQSDEARRWGDLRFVDEHRAWQQLWWTPTDDTTGAAAQVRVRLEQRFRPQANSGTGVRLRVLVRGHVPITRGREWLFVTWDEVFFAANDTGWQTQGYDQNRLFVGLGWQIRPAIARLELGYLNQWLPRPGLDPVHHAVALNAIFGW